MRIGLIKEGKQPEDARVVLTPKQAAEVTERGVEVWVEPSSHRCYSDAEYEDSNVAQRREMNKCDVLLGVKEVPIKQLIPNKTYFFFSHTIKGQSYNMPLLQAVLDKNIRLIDYECLTNEQGQRVIAFGRWAGIVGAHNGLMAFGRRTGTFELPPVEDFEDFSEIKAFYEGIQLPPMKIVLTGNGRVAKGSLEVLGTLNVERLDANVFLKAKPGHAVFTQLNSEKLYRRTADGGFSYKQFYAQPGLYGSAFAPFVSADLLINAMYWDPRAPRLFELDDMTSPSFKLLTIADITCDVGGSVPANLRASSIEEPVYGFDPGTRKEVAPYKSNTVDIMAVDNLPNELPRDASRSFGEMFMKFVLPELLNKESKMLNDATIASGGTLGEKYEYLSAHL